MGWLEQADRIAVRVRCILETARRDRNHRPQQGRARLLRPCGTCLDRVGQGQVNGRPVPTGWRAGIKMARHTRHITGKVHNRVRAFIDPQGLPAENFAIERRGGIKVTYWNFGPDNCWHIGHGSLLCMSIRSL